jgi:hypothetical protein
MWPGQEDRARCSEGSPVFCPVNGVHFILLELAAQRFGPATAETEEVIRTIRDRKRVERMMRRLFEATASGWPELLATP